MLMIGVRSSYLWTVCLADGNSIVLTRIPVVHCFSPNRHNYGISIGYSHFSEIFDIVFV